MSSRTEKSNRMPLMLIFLIVLIDLTGWGMVVPILPTYAEKFHADAFTIGWLIACYSIAQFVFAPMLGRWSDRVGRKPVLLVSMFGTATASLVTGFASASSLAALALPVLFLARILDGATGGNIPTAQSFVADVTTKETRAQGMGMVGAAVGLGYTLGPVLGGVIAGYFGPAMPFFVAATVALINAIVMWFILPETLTPERRRELESHSHAPTKVGTMLRNPLINSLLLVHLLVVFASFFYQSMMPIFTEKQLGFVERDNGYLFAFLGLMTTIVQGGLIRPLVKRVGEVPIFLGGLSILAVSLLATPQAHSVGTMYLFCAGLSVGTALASPTVIALISKRSREQEQGAALGITASVASVARILGPLWGGFAIRHYGSGPAFWGGAVACTAALLIGLLFVVRTGDELESGKEATAG